MNVRRLSLKSLRTERSAARGRRLRSRARVARLRANTQGATAVEYGLILAVIVLAMMMALISVANATTDIWTNVADKVTKAR